jgi:hypothetical protein
VFVPLESAVNPLPAYVQGRFVFPKAVCICRWEGERKGLPRDADAAISFTRWTIQLSRGQLFSVSGRDADGLPEGLIGPQ